MMGSEQLLLNLRPPVDARLQDFVAPEHALLVAACRELPPLLYIHGEAGCGCSHLLAALCAEAGAAGLSALMLPMDLLVREAPDILQGLEGQALVALDEVDAVAGHAEWEEALFHFFNRARAEGCRLVFAASQPPASVGFDLQDLVSRLGLAPCWRLALPDDAGREAVIKAVAARRGWVMETDLLRYLVQRGPRGVGRLLVLMDWLDRRSLLAGRRLTIPFVRPLLDEFGSRVVAP